MSRRTYYASEAGGNEDLVRLALVHLKTSARQDAATEAWLVGNSKDDLKSGVVANALGEHAASLKAGRPVDLAPGCRLQFFSGRMLPAVAKGVSVLACWPTPDLLNKLDAIPGIRTLIVLPWNLNDVKTWLDANGAEDILGIATVAKKKVTNPTVLEALESIGASINISAGLTHPSDRDRVIDAFKILRDGGESIDAAQVRAWFQQAGMPPEYALEAFEIAAAPGNFRKASAVDYWPPDVLERWRGKRP